LFSLHQFSHTHTFLHSPQLASKERAEGKSEAIMESCRPNLMFPLVSSSFTSTSLGEQATPMMRALAHGSLCIAEQLTAHSRKDSSR
jgi:hypothetical protein